MSSNFINPIEDYLSPKRFEPICVVPLMPNFGARIEGIDLTADLNEETQTRLREALLRFGVLFFKRQKTLSPEGQLEVARIFGEPDLGSHMVEKARPNVDLITIDEDRPPLTNTWHSDNTFQDAPSCATLIQIQKGPTVGGNTAWACTRKAYQCLSDRMKHYIDDLVAVHYWDGRGVSESSYLNTFDDETYFAKVKKYPPVEHPVVLEHPITKEKSIFVNETYTRFIKGLHKYENKTILDFLYNWIRMPEFHISHHWEENDVAVWDNYAMQHYALADYQATRVNQRVTIGSYHPTQF